MNISWLLIPLSVFWIANADMIRRRCRNDQFECDDGKCIQKGYWCSRNDSYYYCNDRSERINCYKSYPYCGQNEIHCTNNGKCIPLKWACDDYKDCYDNSDELNCLKGIRLKDIPGVENSRKNGRLWLSKQRRKNWSWGKDTNRAVVTFSLSGDFDLEIQGLQIIVMQMKLQLSKLLLIDNIRKFQTYEMALYIHALLATCINPRNFQGFDLVEILEERMKDSDSVNPMVALAICNCNGTLSTTQITELRDLLFKENLPHLIEIRAYAFMALNCLRNKNNSYQQNFTEEIPFNKSNDYYNFNEIKQDFAKLQNKDGSFGNIYTTAVLLHALLSTRTTDDINGNYWNITNAFRYLISQQKKDGSFGDILASYLVLPLMNGKTFIDLGKLNCSYMRQGNMTVQEEFDNKRVGKYRTNYYIVVGENKDIVFSLSLNIPINSTFYDVMRLAAELDPRFRFRYIDNPEGKYIYSIFGLVNNPESRNYWQLLKTEQNSTSIIHYPDKVIVREEETYIFWYKVINI